MKITEQPSHYDHLEQMSVQQIVAGIHAEDCLVAEAVGRVLPQVEQLVTMAVAHLEQGGRLFYIGAGTSGRLGVLDASELPPTFGVPEGMVVGLVAGGDTALRHAVEHAEDDSLQGWRDLQAHRVSPRDIVVGIAASGTTPYVLGALRHCREQGIATGCIVSNPDTPMAQTADVAIETVVGPEFVTGSSRMKSGTAQKMVLNMLSTAVMIRLGHVHGNRMIDMQLTNDKLVDRGTRMLTDLLHVDYATARQLLLQYGSVDEAVKHHHSHI